MIIIMSNLLIIIFNRLAILSSYFKTCILEQSSHSSVRIIGNGPYISIEDTQYIGLPYLCYC